MIYLNPQEVDNQNISELDIIFVTGDAFADHPSNGVAILSRLLEDKQYNVGVLDQPQYKELDSFTKLGKPNLFFGVTAGLLDSMVSNYTPLKKERKNDRLGYDKSMRPDRATIVYAQMLRRAYKDTPIIIGGIEASMRRFSHYDYWQNKVRKSILMDSKADLLIYGMGERQILEIATRLKKQESLDGIKGTVVKKKECPSNCIELPPYSKIEKSKKTFLNSFMAQYKNQDPFHSLPLAESYGDWYVVQYSPALPLTTDEMDYVYGLPYSRDPRRTARGKVNSINSVLFSIISHRGCFGGCSFCSLSMHQGKIIQSRSKESIVNEAIGFLSHPLFKGIIDDVGGPTANMYGMGCKDTKDTAITNSIRNGKKVHIREYSEKCTNKCLCPICPQLKTSHRPIIEVLRELRSIKGIKKVFIRSGIRYDLALSDMEFIRELCKHHVSGQLKVAPEHVDDNVLLLMNKPSIEVFEQFKKVYRDISKEVGKRQYLVPYIMVAHPGATSKSARLLQSYLYMHKIPTEQVQVFTPTPMTLSTAMYYTEINPFTNEKIYVPYSYKEKKEQKRRAVTSRKA
ncbi:MAG: YgiQ family radical SAM protein [Candidatus Methanofastidiosia archaeon]